MKKLLSILGAMTLIGTTSTNVIACDNGKNTNSNKSDAEVTTDIKTALEGIGVNGSSLDNTQKQSTANDLIKEAMKKITDADKVAEATFIFDDGDTLLIAGDNTVNIKVTFNTSSNIQVAVKLNNVAVHKKNDAEVTTDIKTALEGIGVNGSSLDNTQKQSTANDLIKEAMKKITDADKVAEATFIFDDGDTLLIAGDNTVNIKVTFNTSSNIQVAVKLNNVAVHKKNDAEVTTDIKTALEGIGVNGSSLDNTQKQSTANDLIKEAMKKITDADKVAEATFIFDDGDTLLIAGDNTVNIKVTFNTSSNIQVAVKLNNVAVHKKNDAEVTTDIKTALEGIGVNGSSLDNTQKQSTANDLIKEAMKKITDADKVAEATFIFDDGDTLLIAGDNTVNIKVTFNTSSNIQVAVKLNNVAVHKKNDAEVTTDIKTALEGIGVNGSSLDNTQKQSTANDLIKEAMKKITDADKVAEATFIFDDGDTLLIAGDNTVNIKVTFNTSSNIQVAVKLNNVAVHKKNDAEVTTDIKTALEGIGVNGSSLDNTQKQSTANDLIKEAMKKITDADKVAEATFIFDDGDTLLIAGDNTVNIKVTFNTSSNIQVAVKLNNVAVHKKNDLSTITQLTGLHLIADSNKIFKDFNAQILEADQFKNTSIINLNIIYYKSQNWKDKKNVNDKQKVGKYFVKIEVKKNLENINWNGITNYLSIEIFLK